MRALIVGHGKQGARHARVARSLGLEVFTIDPEAPADFTSLQDAPRAEIVCVAVPHAHLYPVASEALLRGSHVLTEKPGGLTAFEVRALAMNARAMGLSFMTGYCERHNPLSVAVKDAVPSIGRLSNVLINRRGPEPENSAGVAYDLLSHDLDLLDYFGLTAGQVRFGGLGHHRAALSLHCEGTYVTLSARYQEQRERYWCLTGQHGIISANFLTGSATFIGREDGTIFVPEGEPLLREWQHFLGTIDGSVPRSDSAGAVAALEAIEQAQEAQR